MTQNNTLKCYVQAWYRFYDYSDNGMLTNHRYLSFWNFEMGSN